MQRETADVQRLASITDSVIERLLNRGISPSSFDEIFASLRANRIPISVKDAIDYVFQPKTGFPTPFKPTRFTSGFWPVFYSSLDAETCIEELRYHKGTDRPTSESGMPPEFFTLFQVGYDGMTKDLLVEAKDGSPLVDRSKSSYPACARIASDAIAGGADALKTRSARRPAGTNIPIFKREAILGEPVVLSRGVFERDNDALTFRPID